MPLNRKTNTFHIVSLVLAMSWLAGCEMPTEPEGYSSQNMTLIGDKLRATGDDEGAANFYLRSLQKKPKDVAAHKALAEIFEAHGDLPRAAEQWRAALDSAPEEGEYLRAYGRILLKQGQPAAARDQFEKALEADSDDLKALNGLGVALDMLGQHDAAQNAYKEALDAKEDDPATLANLGHSYVLTGAYETAIQLLEPHVKDKTATPALRQNLAEAYGMAGMEADAERVARMDLNPEQVKRNLAFYKARRVSLALEPKYYADLGAFPTAEMATARIEAIRAAFAREIEGLVVETKPDVKTIGGTPSFTARVSGFAKPEKLRAFCAALQKAGDACKAKGV